MKLQKILILSLCMLAQDALGMDSCHFCKKTCWNKGFISFSSSQHEQYSCCEACSTLPASANTLLISKEKLLTAYGGDCPICFEKNPDCLMRCCAQGCHLLHSACYRVAGTVCPMCRAKNSSVLLDQRVTSHLANSVNTQTQNCPGCATLFGLDEAFIASSCDACGTKNVCMACAKRSVHKNKCSMCPRRLSDTSRNEIQKRIQIPDPSFERVKDISRMEFMQNAAKNLGKDALLNQYPELDGADIDKAIGRVRNIKLVNSMKSSAPVIGLACGLYAMIRLYAMLSRTKNIDKLYNSAHIAQDTLLSLDFDLLNPTQKMQSMSKQYDIPAILSTIKDTELRDRLERAIAEFDVAFDATHTAISTSYYYHPSAYFLEKEAALVARLESAQIELRSVIDACRRQQKIGYHDFITCGVSLGLSAACGCYWAKANPLKKWGFF